VRSPPRPQFEASKRGDDGTWLDPAETQFWPLLATLKALEFIGKAATAEEVIEMEATSALRSLPRPLRTLSLWLISPAFTNAARILVKAFGDGRRIVAGSRCLKLPDEGYFARLLEGMNAWYQELSPEKVAAVAQARGIKVIQS